MGVWGWSMDRGIKEDDIVSRKEASLNVSHPITGPWVVSSFILTCRNGTYIQ